MLQTLGLRIERLLYFGFVLLLISALQVYFTAAAAYFNATDTLAIDSLVELLERNGVELRELYDEAQRPSRPSTERDARVSKMRARLGLPPQQSEKFGEAHTYKSRLQELLVSLPRWWDLREQFGGALDSGKSPEQILTDLHELRRSRTRERGTVLGIETPRLVTLQYGSADFRVSAQPLATGLLFALYPLSFVWLGSFYVTRQRELLGIRTARDFKAAFPHILNFVVVDFSGLQQRLGFHVKPKAVRLNLLIASITTTVLRCLFVVTAISPLVVGLGYSTFQLFELLSPPLPVIILAIAAFLALAFLGLAVVVQEAIALRGKLFYE